MAAAKKFASIEGIFEPQERLRILASNSSAFEVDPKVPAKRYFRSGVEMLRMGKVYYDEGSLEYAYMLYMKYMTLFLEKIRQHPEYSSVPSDWKIQTQAEIREILPKTEKIKKMLLEQYTKEYTRYMQEVKEQKRSVHYNDLTDMTNNIKSAVNIINPDLLNSISYPTAPTLEDDAVSITPSIDRSSKPSTVIGSAVSLQMGLRTVIIPSKVMWHFLSLASKNTFNNIETCGILAGKLERNELIITHMILPKQKGTPDSCITMNEEEIFDYQDQYNLITIGWIHTHPTQTAFLSSVDLHTHCPYQLLMPEAIAIVCAPRYNETGFFTLDKYGLNLICSCKQSGFHPHPTNPPIYMEADHIKIVNTAPLEVFDLRVN